MSNNNDETIKIIADMLQMQGDEDMALELEEAWARAKHELERIKGIAGRRLDRIAQLQHDVAVLEDKLEDTRSELKSTFGGAPSRAIEELEIERNLAMIYEHDELGREPRSHLELGL
jgi:hypothetical protein